MFDEKAYNHYLPISQKVRDSLRIGVMPSVNSDLDMVALNGNVSSLQLSINNCDQFKDVRKKAWEGKDNWYFN